MTKNSSKRFLVFTVFHPTGIKYFNEFISYYKKQTKINDLFITFNNIKPNLQIINKINSTKEFKIYTINTDLKPGLSRIISFKKIIKLNYDYIIFIDCDDLMHKKRSEDIFKKIKNKDFFVNNLITFKNKKFFKKIINKKGKKIKLKQILDKNYIGNSTLTIKSKSLKKIMKFLNYKLIAFDWCIATNLLLNKFEGIYEDKVISFYRQHNQNVHNKFKSKEKVFQNIQIKKNHYEFFKKRDKIFEKKLNNLRSFEKRFLNDPNRFSKKKYEKYYKWWIL